MKKKITWIVIIALVLSLATVCGIFHEEIYDFLFPVKNDWDEKDGVMYYKDSQGDPVLGWFQYEGNYYYLDPELEGAMVTGWAELEDGIYYLNEQGNPHSGWLDLDGQEYYLDEDCRMLTGWLEQDGLRYYFAETGQRTTGIVTVEEGVFYLAEDGSIYSGWLNLEDATYYFDQYGMAVTEWLELDGNKYYLDPGTAAMVTGWLDTEEGRYYLDDAGVMYTGWLELEESRYFLGEDGLMATGWLEDNGRTYYMAEDGTMSTGKVTIEESTYYFTSTGAQLILVNRWNPVPEGYKPELVTFKGREVDITCYNDLVQMLKDCPYSYEITSAYRSKATQQAIWDKRMATHQANGYSYAAALQMTTDYVAVPGTSEHQLGLAVDISGDSALKWLEEHCWEYGFILRYLDGKSDITGIKYEKWHFRYVGVELAMEMKDTGLCLEEYIDLLTNDGTTCGNPDLVKTEN